MAQNSSSPHDQLVELLLEGRERLVSFITARVSDRDVAEDILQDSLLRALRAAPGLRESDRLAPWLIRIVRNGIIDHLRRRGTAHAALTRFEQELDRTVTPEEHAAICACFEDILPVMKDSYAELIRRMDLAEEPASQVAEDLGLTRENLKVRHHRARRQLRDRLAVVCRSCAQHSCLDCSCRRDQGRL